jgi:uncharacterized protein YecE (DUF72 family)
MSERRAIARPQPWRVERKGLTASSQRFNYDYNQEELKEIGSQVQQIARKVETTHVLFNNNYQDHRQRGAGALTNILVA